MDEQTATRLAAQQLVDQLGKAAGFMIALRIMQVLAERSSPVTPELIDAFSACLRGMEKFASLAGLAEAAAAEPAEGEGASSAGAASSSEVALNGERPAGISDPLAGVAESLGGSNGRGGWGSNGTPLA